MGFLNMNDIFDEAEKELKNIKKARFIKISAYVFIFVSIIAILTTGIYKWNESRFTKKVLRDSDMFLAIFAAEKEQLSETDMIHR